MKQFSSRRVRRPIWLSRRTAAIALATAGAATLAPAHIARAQVTGTWIADVDGPWSNPTNWANGNVPGDGGTATFAATPFIHGRRSVALDTDVSLTRINFNSGLGFSIVPSGNHTITLSTADATIATPLGPLPGAAFEAEGQLNAVDAELAGIDGMTKSGNGGLVLRGTNTFSGDVRITGGTLFIPDNRDDALGDPANRIVLSNGAALSNLPSNPSSPVTFVSSRNITLSTGGGELRSLAPMQLNGVISGTTNLTTRGASTLTLTGANTFSGQTIIRDNGTVALTGAAGSIAGSSLISVSGSLVLDNRTAVNPNRIGSGVVDLNGGSLQLLGHATTDVNETVGEIILRSGQSVITVAAANGAAAQLSASRVTRWDYGTALLRGDALGSSSANAARITAATAPTLVGGGGAPGTTSISIVPWLIGNTSSSAALDAPTNSLVTYGDNGFRPLDLSTEFANTFAGATSTTNVAIASPTVLNNAVSVNALVLRGQDVSGTGTINVASGAVLINAPGGTYATPMTLPNGAIVHATSSGTFAGSITGGFTKSGGGTITLLSPNHIGLCIAAGTVRVRSGTIGDFLQPLGTGNVILRGGVGANVPRLYGMFNNNNLGTSFDITVSNATTDSVGVIGVEPGSTPGNTFTFTGITNVDRGYLRFEGLPGVTPSLIFTSAMNGIGGVTDANGSSQVISSNSQFGGGTIIRSGTYYAGAGSSGSAFGLGSIIFANTEGPTAANPYPGAVGAFGAARGFRNPILIKALGPDDGDPSMLGVCIVGNQLLNVGGPVDLGGKSRLFTVVNTATTLFSGTISNGGLEKGGPGMLVLLGSNTYTGATKVHAGTLDIRVNSIPPTSALSIDAGAAVTLSRFVGNPPGKITLDVPSFTMAGGAQPAAWLDLNNNDMRIASGSYDITAAQVRSGYNFGAWDGLGIVSTAARINPNANTTLGVLTGAEFIDNSGGATFNGRSVNPTDVLVKYTYFGDVDFNGRVDVSDYNLIDFGFVNHLSGWANGDADYSGAVDVSDYNLIDFAFATQSGTLARAIQFLDGSDRSTNGMNGDPSLQEVASHFEQFGETYASGFLAAVPEPSSLGGAIVMAAAWMRRRRRAV